MIMVGVDSTVVQCGVFCLVRAVQGWNAHTSDLRLFIACLEDTIIRLDSTSGLRKGHGDATLKIIFRLQYVGPIFPGQGLEGKIPLIQPPTITTERSIVGE